MTPRYLQAVIKGKTQNDQNAWVIARQTAYWSILPHVGKKRLKPSDLGSFSWEKIDAGTVHNPYGSREALNEELRKFKELTETLEFKPAKDVSIRP